MILKPCEVCDELTDRSRCPEHRPTPKAKAKTKQDDYNTAWDNLSRRARKLQPFCLWCLTTEDLQLDHTPAAWEAKAAGKPITLAMVRVLCAPCNVLAGQARPGPGQRTSEERPDTTDRSGPGRLLHPGGEGSTAPTKTPAMRQNSSNTPVLLPAGRLVEPW